jgi:hypothetical protein
VARLERQQSRGPVTGVSDLFRREEPLDSPATNRLANVSLKIDPVRTIWPSCSRWLICGRRSPAGKFRSRALSPWLGRLAPSEPGAQFSTQLFFLVRIQTVWRGRSQPSDITSGSRQAIA